MVTPMQLMRPDIWQNVPCVVGDFTQYLGLFLRRYGSLIVHAVLRCCKLHHSNMVLLPHAIDNICFPLLDIVPGILFLMTLEWNHFTWQSPPACMKWAGLPWSHANEDLQTTLELSNSCHNRVHSPEMQVQDLLHYYIMRESRVKLFWSLPSINVEVK